MKPSCWLPTVRLTQRDIGAPGRVGTLLARQQRALDALEEDAGRWPG